MTDGSDGSVPVVTAPFVISASTTRLHLPPERLAAGFAQTPALACRDILDADLLDRVRDLCRRARFLVDVVPDVGVREVETPPVAGATLTVLLQRPELRDWIRRATGTAPLGQVKGSVAQSRPSGGQQLDWHDDGEAAGTDRLLAITVNLGDEPFAGGAFELRSRRTGAIVRFQHDRPGSALIFAVRPDLEHRVLPVTDGGPRRVFGGWFLAASA